MNKRTDSWKNTIIPNASTNVSFLLILCGRHAVNRFKAAREVRPAAETDVLGDLGDVHIRLFQQFGSCFQTDILDQFDG